jgi:hypothetical protein
MRWRLPTPGDLRVKRGFLFFPKWINGEWRWFEFAAWEEIYAPVEHSERLDWSPYSWITVH